MSPGARRRDGFRQTEPVPTISSWLPRVAQFLPPDAPDLPISDSPAAFVGLLQAIDQAASGKTIFGHTQVGEAAMDDLDDLHDEKLLQPAQVAATRVGVGTFVAIAACTSGDLESARTWLVRGLGGTAAPDSKLDFDGLMYLRAGAARRNVTAEDVVAGFAYALFYMAREAGYLSEVTDFVGERLAADLAMFPVCDSAVDAVSNALWWARSVGREDLAQPLREWCLRAADEYERPEASGASPIGPLEPLVLRFGVAISLPEGLGRTQALDEVVARVDDQTPPGLAVQVLAAACEGDADRARILMPRILDAIVANRKEWEEHLTSEQIDEVRERQFSTLGAPLTVLARDGDMVSVANLLRSWSGIDEPLSPPAADRVLLCLHGNEHTYAWAGGSCRTPVSVSSQRLSSATNAALGTALVATGPDAEPLLAPATGKIHRPSGIEYGNVCRDLLALDLCPDFVKNVEPAAWLIPIPGFRVPYQGLLAERGAAPAMWVSLREPAPDRPVGRVLIAQADTALSAVEAELAAAVFTAAGIDVDQVAATEGPQVADRVNSALASDEYDVIWVAAHGRQPEYDPEAAAIYLPSGRRLTDSDLKVVPAEQSARRLLVLSSCDAAATIQATGLRARGLAAAAAGPHQAVVGHQWVVDERLAAAFGVLLSAAIAQTRNFNDAFDQAMRWLQRPWAENAELLATYDLDPEQVDRVRGRNEFSENVLDFGAPAFYC